MAKSTSCVPPLNLCLIAEIIRSCGWDVMLIDGEVEDLTSEQIADRVKEYSPDLIGLTATSVSFGAIRDFAAHLKTVHDWPIMIGGVHVSLMKEESFEDCFDYLCIGEGELFLPVLLDRLANNQPVTDVLGIMSKDEEGNIHYPGNAEIVQDMDTIPIPARDLLKLDLYNVGTLDGRKNFTTIAMSRGCPFHCVFCSHGLFGKKVRRRSVENVILEIEHVVNDLGIKHLFFLDDTLTLDRDFIMRLCDAIEERQLKFTFEGGTRANLWDEELVHRLKACGLIRISFGLESADPEVREIMKKKVPLESYVEANKLNNKLGIETINSVMLGLPGETRESIKRTIDFLRSSKDIHHATYGIAMPYPGTEMLEMALKEEHGLVLKEKDFSKYTRYDSAVMAVNGIEPEELVKLQREGLLKIYSCWWRIIPTIKRHGLLNIAIMGTLSVVQTIADRLSPSAQRS